MDYWKSLKVYYTYYLKLCLGMKLDQRVQVVHLNASFYFKNKTKRKRKEKNKYVYSNIIDLFFKPGPNKLINNPLSKVIISVTIFILNGC